MDYELRRVEGIIVAITGEYLIHARLYAVKTVSFHSTKTTAIDLTSIFDAQFSLCTIIEIT